MNFIESDERERETKNHFYSYSFDKPMSFCSSHQCREKHVRSSIDLEKSLKTHTKSFVVLLFLPSHTSFLLNYLSKSIFQPVIQALVPFLFLSLFFFQSSLSFITLSVRHTSDRARLSSIYCHRIFLHNVPCTLCSPRCSR